MNDHVNRVSARRLAIAIALAATFAHAQRDAAFDATAATREFEIRDDRPFLGGAPVELWGIRCGNALHSDLVTERHVRALDNMIAHGINLIAVYVQGSNGGWPDSSAGSNGYSRLGALGDGAARRLEWLVREADRRGMVVMVGLCSPRKDQEFADDDAIRRAVVETARFLRTRGLRNVFVDLMHEYGHGRVDQELFREPGGVGKKAQLAAWFHGEAPDIEVGVCGYVKADTAHPFPGEDIRMIQKHAAIPSSGYVVNVETQKQDCYENDGVFTPGSVQYVLNDCRRFHAEPRATLIFHAGFVQGIGNGSGTGPHPEMGGYGTGVGDRGVRFYYEWVRDNLGQWRYPRHVPFAPAAAEAAPAATREFAIADGIPHVDGHAVELWGVRCHNALMSDATAQRLQNNLANMTAHGINLIGLCMQGTNGGYHDKDAGANAYAPNGALLPAYAARLEELVRAADAHGMVVCLTLMTPRRDGELRDEAAVQRAIEGTARLLAERRLRNVFVNVFHEFDHPLRIDHAVFEEPDGAEKRARLARWFTEQAPGIEVGICNNHESRADASEFDVRFVHEDMPLPDSGFVVNVEPPDRDLAGNEGVFNRFHRESFHREWTSYLGEPRTALLFRSPFVESVRGNLGTGPNYAVGGGGVDTSDRGVRPYYDWLAENVGPWQFPRHVRR